MTKEQMKKLEAWKQRHLDWARKYADWYTDPFTGEEVDNMANAVHPQRPLCDR